MCRCVMEDAHLSRVGQDTHMHTTIHVSCTKHFICLVHAQCCMKWNRWSIEGDGP